MTEVYILTAIFLILQIEFNVVLLIMKKSKRLNRKTIKE